MDERQKKKQKHEKIVKDFIEAPISIAKIGGDKTGAGPISDANVGGTATGAGPISERNVGGVRTAGVKAKAKKKLAGMAAAAAPKPPAAPAGGATPGIPSEAGVK